MTDPRDRDPDLDKIEAERDDLDAQVREQVARDKKDRHAGPRRPFRT